MSFKTILFERCSIRRAGAMGGDEYGRFYVEMPRPILEEWGGYEELIAAEEYKSKEEFYKDW